jgi:hypothetical protein
MIEGKGRKARRLRRQLRPKSRTRSGVGNAHRFGKRLRMLKLLAKACVLVYRERFAVSACVHRESCRTPCAPADKDVVRIHCDRIAALRYVTNFFHHRLGYSLSRLSKFRPGIAF